MSELINAQLQAQRAQLEEVVKDLHELTIRIGHEEMAETVSDLRNRLHEPFMFVIVGEVKAGKSSFVNALLATGKEITKVAPQPMTDTIQQILYGEQYEEVEINQYLKKILVPAEILQDIAIVDTPGTNTIVEHHQEITERFVPASDLIVFVFEAKNPYRQSAWQFFDFIQGEWRKKVIFVLQQKDLMSADDLAININGVKEQASKKGIEEPKVFAVSALQEQEGHTEESGFESIRNFISENITGGQAPTLKLLSSIETAQNINERIASGLKLRRQQYEADQAFRLDIKDTLEGQEKQSFRQTDILVENLLAGYDRITRDKENELKGGLSLFGLVRRSISSVFSSQPSAKQWLEQLSTQLETDLNEELRKKLNIGVVDLAESIQQMAKLIDLKIRNSETILKNNHDIFSDIAERRGNVLRDLQDQFANFIKETENFTDETLFPEKGAIAPNLLTGSGLAAVGVIIATVIQGSVFDITGGLITTVGLLFAGFSTRSKRRKILSGFSSEVERGRLKLESEVTERLKSYISQLKGRIDHNFDRFDEMLEKEGQTLELIESQHKQVDTRLSEMKDAL